MNPASDLDNIETYAHIPFDKRWEYLRPVIERLRRGEGKVLKTLMCIMKEKYHFDASESQYKYRFKKWGATQSLPAGKKRKIADKLEDRAVLKKSKDAGYATVLYKGDVIDMRKILREIKNIHSNADSVLFFESKSNLVQESDLSILRERNFFLKWRLPYEALVGAKGPLQYPSPLGGCVSTPSNVIISTPEANEMSETNKATMSSLSSALRGRQLVQRSHLFARGKHMELIKELSEEERKYKRIMSIWLHQFWLFAFTTAQNWGSGPRKWTADLLGFHIPLVLHNSPLYHAEIPQGLSPRDLREGHTITPQLVTAPTQLCRWSIHVYTDSYAIIDGDPDENFTSHQAWPAELGQRSFQEQITDNLHSNDFSSITRENLPLSNEELANAAQNSPNELLLEAIGFAIMGRNEELLANLLKERNKVDIDIFPLRPLHLAASYLDGSRTCCVIFYLVKSSYHRKLSVQHRRAIEFNDLGHSVLDVLLLRILHSHSSINIGTIVSEFRNEQYWLGQEVDICGRWDATSNSYQDLLKSGQMTIPNSWKHKFCHTSIQAVTHSFNWLDIDTNSESGLFSQLCADCGCRLVLSPLHSLVMTAWLLATHSMEGEDLFGISCCLFALLNNGFDPTKKAQISSSMLTGSTTYQCCDHQELTAAGLACVLDKMENPHKLLGKTTYIGWKAFVKLLQESETVKYRISTLDNDEYLDELEAITDGYTYCDEVCSQQDSRDLFLGHSVLGHIWATMQAELLHYRRLEIGDPWLSNNFNLAAVLPALNDNTQPSMPFLDDDKLQNYCRCGRWNEVWPHPRREDVAKEYFANLDIWERTEFMDDKIFE